MRKLCIILICVLLIVITAGCDEGLLMEGLDIEKYPDRIVYYAGIDYELDLDGGVLKVLTKNSQNPLVEMSSDEFDFYYKVKHNIKFSIPGVYVVEIYRNKNVIVKFPVQVIDIDNLNITN